jgi:hypothetical protein
MNEAKAADILMLLMTEKPPPFRITLPGIAQPGLR